MYVEVFLPSSSNLPVGAWLYAHGSEGLVQEDFEVSMDVWFGSAPTDGPCALSLWAGSTGIIEGYDDFGPYYYSYSCSMTRMPPDWPGGGGGFMQLEGPGFWSRQAVPFPLNTWGRFKWENKPSIGMMTVSFEVGSVSYGFEVPLIQPGDPPGDVAIQIGYGTDSLGPYGLGWKLRLDNVWIGNCEIGPGGLLAAIAASGAGQAST